MGLSSKISSSLKIYISKGGMWTTIFYPFKKLLSKRKTWRDRNVEMNVIVLAQCDVHVNVYVKVKAKCAVNEIINVGLDFFRHTH